ncbi:MAG: CDP-glucose 4,6-dehydratase, partial [Kiritimatiellia bacterium]
EVHVLALDPPTKPSLWHMADLGSQARWHRVDIRDAAAVQIVIDEVQADAVMHLAAQALVRASYDDPMLTVQTNVMGTVNLLQGIHRLGRACAVLIVTTDKVYQQREWVHGYRENDALGGLDLYSASKAAAELLTAAWRDAFLHPDKILDHGIAIATVRAGNVIGPGDFTPSRLVPHVLSELIAHRTVELRSPDSIRPWQHVLEPLAGYLTLTAALLPDAPDRAAHCTAYNLGPWSTNARTVREVVQVLSQALDRPCTPTVASADHRHEAGVLRLSIDKAIAHLPWRPVWDFEETIRRTAHGHRALLAAHSVTDALDVLDADIQSYTLAARCHRPALSTGEPDDLVHHVLQKLPQSNALACPRPGDDPVGQPRAPA